MTITLGSHIACGGAWQLLDYDGKIVVKGSKAASELSFGLLAVGHYRLESTSKTSTHKVGDLLTTVSVVAPLKAPVGDGPVCLKAQLAFRFYRKNLSYTPEDAAHMIALAGVSYVQEALVWRLAGIEKIVDRNVKACAEAGLNVFVTPSSTPEKFQHPKTFGRPVKKFSKDLRDFYHHLQAVASKFPDNVKAWEIRGEPEGNGGYFLPHEMAAGNKVASLALKSINKNYLIGQGFHSDGYDYLEDELDNHVSDYIDLWFMHAHSNNYHLKKHIDDYAKRLSILGPVWGSEVSYGYYPFLTKDKVTTEVSIKDEKVMAQDICRFYARSIMSHESKAFYFRFFTHSQVKGKMWGMVRNSDLTTRPQYNAMAAASRLL
ncbi:MAG: hypothetical protein JKX85_04265, partial [Phycisphaeraceae bacterium]|nr:hypothetical protein [Phycisphaeraceae bacterium]